MKRYWIKGDINGIQKFIYKVYEGEGGVAKILRAKSFYIEMLSKAVSKFLQKELKKNLKVLEVKEILNGGGGFILEASTEETSEEKVEKTINNSVLEIEKFLLKHLHGEIGVTIAFQNVEEEKSYDKLSQKLDELKKKRFLRSFEAIKNGKEDTNIKIVNGIFIIEEKGKKQCPICKTFFTDGKICEFCNRLMEAGKVIPKVEFDIEEPLKENDAEEPIFFFKFKDTFYFLDKCNKIEENRKFIIKVPILSKNIKNEEIQNLEVKSGENLYKNSVAPFEIMSLYSKGDKKIGYLTMDVDNLGLLFSKIDLIFQKDIEKKLEVQRDISKIIDEFFKKKIPQIADRFKPTENDNLELIENSLIYILYSGGDDLFAIGPWDKLLDFAIAVNNEFHHYLKTNLENLVSKKGCEHLKDVFFKKENGREKNRITLSAGFGISKPKFTIRVAADRCLEKEKEAKRNGKDAISIFDIIILWSKLNGLINEANYWIEKVEKKEISRSFFYKIHQLYKKTMKGNKKDFIFYPISHYIIARTVKENLRDEILNIINSSIEKKKEHKIDFLCNYILTSTRGTK